VEPAAAAPREKVEASIRQNVTASTAAPGVVVRTARIVPQTRIPCNSRTASIVSGRTVEMGFSLQDRGRFLVFSRCLPRGEGRRLLPLRPPTLFGPRFSVTTAPRDTRAGGTPPSGERARALSCIMQVRLEIVGCFEYSSGSSIALVREKPARILGLQGYGIKADGTKRTS